MQQMQRADPDDCQHYPFEQLERANVRHEAGIAVVALAVVAAATPGHALPMHELLGGGGEPDRLHVHTHEPSCAIIRRDSLELSSRSPWFSAHSAARRAEPRARPATERDPRMAARRRADRATRPARRRRRLEETQPAARLRKRRRPAMRLTIPQASAPRVRPRTAWPRSTPAAPPADVSTGSCA